MTTAAFKRLLLVAGLLGLSVTVVSAGPVSSAVESLPPSMGGLPADAPAPPKTEYQYPAVHDMPPPRIDKTLSDDQQLDLEKQLLDARDRQLRRAAQDAEAAEDGDAPDGKPAVTKKKPSGAKKAPKAAAQAGTKSNP
ncbi:MAG TPA: hypothetical protein VN655_09760 [Pseudolabrys sp.]|nr:hypothetical protein [Pseudolabrys sp.]